MHLQLLYCSPVWAPVYKSDINLIESLQRHFTKTLNGLRYLFYEQRLNTLSAESLELQRLKLDLSLTFKCLHSQVAVDQELFCFKTDCQTRGDFKVFKTHCSNNARSVSFTCRRTNCWNSLPNHLRSAQSLYLFKHLINSCDFTAYLVSS